MTALHIAALHVKNIKRIREIEIRPSADKAIILIAGENAQGKSSILDALTMAIGGKSEIPPDPVNHDGAADGGEIRVELDGATKLVVRRRISADGTSTLEVRDDMGAMKSPQAVLDRLVADRFLDPLAFLALKPTEQRAALLRLVDKDGAIAALDVRRDRVFSRRTELGRDLKRLQAQVEATPTVEIGAPIDVTALHREIMDISKRKTEASVAAAVFKSTEERLARAANATEVARAAIVQAKAKLALAESGLATAIEHERECRDRVEADRASAGPQDPALAAREGDLIEQITKANAHNQGIANDRARAEQRDKLEAERQRVAGEVGKLNGEIEEIDGKKTTALAAARLPVDGLGVSADGVTLGGVPLSQSSGAERLRVALGVAIAANPNLRDVWIKDGALLDDNSLAVVADYCAKVGIRAWIERVGTRDAGAIVIHDGRVVEQAAPAASTQGSLFG